MIQAVLLDLDGTIYMGNRAVPGAADFVALLKQKGVRSLFVTNRANRTPDTIREHLARYGIHCENADILTSAQATAQYLKPGSAFIIGEEGLRQAIDEAGMTLTDEAPDYVIVSFDRTFTYGKLEKACSLIENGATYIATNPDKCLRVEGGISPGTGAIIAAVTAGCDAEPQCIGKPEKRLFEMALQRLDLPKEQVIAVGDNVETDVPAGHKAGLRTALLLTGISKREDVAGAACQPTWTAENYEELTRILAEEWPA